MAFVHGHPRETGWVVSHYRRPQVSGDGQLALPSPRPPDDADREPVDGHLDDAVEPETAQE